MGVREIRDSFNLVANPDATANKALLDYETVGGIQYQVLTFEGYSAGGAKFSIRSDRIRPNGDPILMARATAKRALETLGVAR